MWESSITYTLSIGYGKEYGGSVEQPFVDVLDLVIFLDSSQVVFEDGDWASFI